MQIWSLKLPEHQNSVNHSKPIQFYVAKLKNGQLAINCVDRNCCKRKRFSMFWHLLLSSTKFVFARIRFIHSFFEIDFYWFGAVVNCTFLPDIQIPHCCRDLRYKTLFLKRSPPRSSFLRHTQRSKIQKLDLFWEPQKI